MPAVPRAIRLHLGGPVEPEQPPEVGGGVLLERLGALDAQERQEQEREDGRAQPVDGFLPPPCPKELSRNKCAIPTEAW